MSLNSQEENAMAQNNKSRSSKALDACSKLHEALLGRSQLRSRFQLRHKQHGRARQRSRAPRLDVNAAGLRCCGK